MFRKCRSLSDQCALRESHHNSIENFGAALLITRIDYTNQEVKSRGIKSGILYRLKRHVLSFKCKSIQLDAKRQSGKGENHHESQGARQQFSSGDDVARQSIQCDGEIKERKCVRHQILDVMIASGGINKTKASPRRQYWENTKFADA